MFESQYIKINEHGIDLLKNHQVFKHLDYREINQIEIKKGHLIINWIASIIISLTLSILSIIWGVKSAMTFEIHNIPSSHIRSYLAFRIIPWILFIGGVIWLFISLKRCNVMKIKTNQKNYKIALIEFEQDNSLSDMVNFLSERVEIKNL